MVLPVTTSVWESPKIESESESHSERLKIWFHKTILGFGLPEIDKLLAEAEEIKDPVTNSTSTDLEQFLKRGNDTEDFISRLPNDILQFIISLLTMREGASTSILSTRWRDLWGTSASCLNFDAPNMLGYKYPYDIGIEQQELQDSLRTKFVTRVDHICQLCRVSKMDTIRVSFPFYDDSAGDIDKWMEFAAAQGVTKVALDFSWHTCMFYGGKKYEFPFQGFNSSLKYLDLRTCTIHFPPNFQGLNSLTSLKLSNSFLTDKDVQNILVNCHSLQWLSIDCCNFPDLTSLKFVGPSIQIKHLHIGNCYKVLEIKLQDTNLLSFELIADECPKLSIKNVPHLARLVLNTIEPVEISDIFPSLETLFLQREEGEMPKLSVFQKLKRLVFTDDDERSNLHEVICFLEACPMLQQLELDMLFAGTELDEENDAELEKHSELEGLNSKISSRVGCSHHHLKEVNIYGFDSHPEIIELIKYLLENAVVLEKMVINRKSKSYMGDGGYRCSTEPSKLVGMSLEKVRKLLNEKAHPTTQILIV